MSDDNKSKMTIAQKSDFVCEDCGQGFDDVEVFLCHRAQYQNHHSYCLNCNVFFTNIHTCRKEMKETPTKNKLPDYGENVEKSHSKAMQTKMTSKRKISKSKSITLRFKCEQCVLSFATKRSLQRHLLSMHKKQRRCLTCEEVFASVSEYWEHVTLHDPNDKVVCKECSAEFSTVGQFRLHLRCYPGPHNFTCKMCLRQFKTESRLDEHVCVCPNGEPLLCACGKEFVTYPSLIEHAQGTSPFCCCSCEFTSHNLANYIRHIRKHSRQKPYQCAICNALFSMFQFLKHHIITAHNVQTNTDPRSCGSCLKVFESEADLKRHGEIHGNRVPCPECTKCFRPECLEKHRKKHKRRSSLCPDCGRLFESHVRLTQHLSSAHKSDPVTCEHCGKTLKTKKILLEHLKTHWTTEVGSRVAQAVCPMCGLELAQKGSLSRHILLVHERHKLVVDETPVVCKECGITLPNKAKYYTHRRQHRAMVERFRCSFCSREFNKKQNLYRHIYLLHNSMREVKDASYSCDYCSRFFREKKNLARHYRLVHKISD